jgi:hypothetical protein
MLKVSKPYPRRVKPHGYVVTLKGDNQAVKRDIIKYKDKHYGGD